MVFQMKIKNAAMNIVDEEGERYIDSSRFKLFIGTSQPDKRSRELTGKNNIILEVNIE